MSESAPTVPAGVAGQMDCRVAEPADRDALASLHLEIWRAAYRDLAPPAAYEALDESHRRAHWDDLLARDPASSRTLVVDRNGELLGFGHAGAATHETLIGAGEIVHLYVHPSRQGTGLGHRLFDELFRFLADTGWRRIRLTVVAGNAPAIRFYERAGGRCVGEYVEGVVWRSQNLIYEWSIE